MKKTPILLCLLAALLIPAIAQAKPKGEGQGKRFDTNGDGLISKAEVDASGKRRLIENFDKIDTNGDGNLTRDEMKARRKMVGQDGKGKGKLKQADTDQNGALSIDEASAAGMDKMVENFDKIDLDGDGEITRKEMKQLRKQLRQRKQQGKGPRNDEA